KIARSALSPHRQAPLRLRTTRFMQTSKRGAPWHITVLGFDNSGGDHPAPATGWTSLSGIRGAVEIHNAWSTCLLTDAGDSSGMKTGVLTAAVFSGVCASASPIGDASLTVM